MNRAWVGLPIVAALVAAACSDATGTVSGGQSRLPLSGACTPGFTTGLGGTTWTDLYRDILGPSGKASCAGTPGNCHGDMSSAGYSLSNYVCPLGDSKACYSSLTSSSSNGLLIPGKPFEATGLYLALRKEVDGGFSGTMPKQPSNVCFTPDDLQRIGMWYAAGSPDN